jgi:hypothetical protein
LPPRLGTFLVDVGTLQRPQHNIRVHASFLQLVGVQERTPSREPRSTGMHAIHHSRNWDALHRG